MDVHLAHTIGSVVSFILGAVKLLVLVSIFTSWIGDRSNPIVQSIFSITEPLYRPFRPLARKIPGPLDWTPVIIFIFVLIIDGLVVVPLLNYGDGGIRNMVGP